jgi:WXG100 family type VII secretion target
MADIKVTFGAIDNLASSIDTQVRQIEGQLEDLRSAITKLGQEWTGAANSSFGQIQNNWNQSADDLKQVLNRIAVAVHSAHDAYQTTENKNASVWG